MTTLLTVLIVVAAILMILIVLVQKSKGGGLSSGFSSSNAIMGVRKTTDFLEKATWGLAGFIIVCSIAVVAISPSGSAFSAKSAVGAPTPVEQGTPDLSPNLPTIPTAPAEGGNE